MSLLEMFHSVATGSRWKRELLTPVGLLIFGLTLAAVVLLGLFTGRLLPMPELLPGSLGKIIGAVLLVLGAAYAEYKRRVPMFIPRPWRRGASASR